MPIRTMIVDDQADVRLLLRLVLERASAVEVACEAGSGIEALELVDRCDPCVIVLDQMMPGLNGVETAIQIIERRPDQLVILFSAYLDDDVVRRARSAGVAATVPKDDYGVIPEVIREITAA